MLRWCYLSAVTNCVVIALNGSFGALNSNDRMSQSGREQHYDKRTFLAAIDPSADRRTIEKRPLVRNLWGSRLALRAEGRLA